MSIMERMQRIASAVLVTKDGAILYADVIVNPIPPVPYGHELVVLFEVVGATPAVAMQEARDKLLSEAYAWVGPIAREPGRAAYRHGPVLPKRPLEHRPTRIPDLVSDAIAKVLHDRGYAFAAGAEAGATCGRPITGDVAVEAAYEIGNLAHAWMCDYGLARQIPEHGKYGAREVEDNLLRSALRLARAYESRMRSSKSDQNAIAMFTEHFDAHKRAAVAYSEPLHTDTAAGKLREAFDKIRIRLGHALDGLDSARGYIESASARAEAPEDTNR